MRLRGLAAAIADGLIAALIGASLVLLLVGRYRVVLGGSPVTIAWWHLTFAAAAIGAIRSAAVPSPSPLERLAQCRTWIRDRPDLGDALLAWALTRPAVLLVALIAVVTIGFPRGADQPGIGRLALPALPARFDANWYAGIALDGYDWQARFDRQQNVAFFPAYPLIIRGAGYVSNAFDDRLPRERQVFRLTWCGLVLSLAAFLWAAWHFARLARDVIDDANARDALLLLSSYPFAVFFSAAYTEALFLLAALGAWHGMRTGRFAAASAWGLTAGLARPNGFFLSVPLALIAIGMRDGPEDRRGAARGTLAERLAVAAMPAAGMMLFTAYLYRETGVWFAWARMHGAWGRVFSGELPVPPGANGGGWLQLAAAHPYDALNGLGAAFALAMAWPVWRRLGPAWSAYVLLNVVPPLFAGGVLSMGRLSSTLFPIFLALGAILSPAARPAVVAAFAIGQGLVTVLFYTWRSLY